MKIKTLLLLIIAFAIGCKQTKKTNNGQTIIDNTQNSNTELLEQSNTELIALNGYLDKIPVSLALYVFENQVYGYYVYSKIGIPISLTGYVDAQKQIILDEYNDKIEKSAKIEIKLDESTGKYYGKWYNSKKSLSLDLSLVTVENNKAEFETNIGKLITSFVFYDTVVDQTDCKMYKINLIYRYKKNEEITYDYTSYILMPDYSNNINLEKAIRDIVKPFENSASRAYYIDQSILKEWKDFLKEYNPDEPSGSFNYSLEESFSFIDYFDGIYVFEANYYQYTGGAHGMYGNSFEFADAKNEKN